jgi:hypothetical protein
VEREVIDQAGAFTIYGDEYAAYLYLKQKFESKPSLSGPVKPLSNTEKLIEQNKPVVDFLKDAPEEHII